MTSLSTARSSAPSILARYEQELAYYRADAPYLTVEKCAERCAKLSLLLTEARATAPFAFTDSPISRSL